MSIKVQCRRLGVSPRKVRQVCDLLRGEYVSEALQILRFCSKREIALALTKLINSSLSIASESGEYDLDELIVANIFVDEGKVLKRIRAMSKGRAGGIRKRSCHVSLEIAEGE